MNCDDLTDAELIACELDDIDNPFLIETATIERFAQTQTASGGRLETWTADADTIMAKVSQVKPAEETRQGERKADQSAGYKIETARTVDLRVRDHIVIGPTTYEVMGVMEKESVRFSNAYWCSIVEGF